VQHVVDTLLEPFERDGGSDLVAGYADLIPVTGPRVSVSLKSSDLRDLDVRGVVRQALHVVLVHRRDHGSTQEISNCHYERVYSLYRSNSCASKKLPGSHSHSRVHRVNLDTLSTQPREDARIAWSAPNNFSQDRRDCGHGEFSPSHLGDQRSHPVSPKSRPVGDARDGLTVQQKHQPARREARRRP
jgi:hypothetical protein